MKYDIKKQVHSFHYAFNGMRQCLKEQNFAFDVIAAAIVVIAGFTYHITHTEWMIVMLCIGCVLTAEAFNTAIEQLVDFVSPAWNQKAGKIKDIAAGAVLITAITAAIVGFLVFIPYII